MTIATTADAQIGPGKTTLCLPATHYFTYVVHVSYRECMFRACDVAGVTGFGRDVECGTGRHGPPSGIFICLRDPHGHRLEFITPPMQMIDLEIRRAQ